MLYNNTNFDNFAKRQPDGQRSTDLEGGHPSPHFNTPDASIKTSHIERSEQRSQIAQFAAWGFTFTLLNGKVPFTKGWQNRPFTAEEASRHPGNAGVHAGTHSNNTVWIDTDTGFPHLLDTFPILKNSLISYRDNAPERGRWRSA
ncbi:MAG: hypothetical protein IPL32_19530 [Chloracidobacterium sp.]|nr:hypothetical protein [Chloracidobacterium sp.]